MTPTQLDPLLGQTYHRKRVGKSGVICSETYACVVKVTEEDSWLLYDKRYNELALTHHKESLIGRDDWLCLTLYSIDDGWWRGFLPYTGQDLFLLWCSVSQKITPTIDQLWTNEHKNNWLCFSHDYFLQITKELGVTEYDYG